MAKHASVRHRPRDFESVFGQREIVAVLAHDVVRDDPRHVILTGPSGTGKTTLSHIYAQAWLCEQPLGTGSPCGSCEACVSFNQGANPDFLKLHCPSRGSKEDIDYVLHEFLGHSPLDSRYRVLLLDEAQALSLQAQEMLLGELQAEGKRAICILTVISADSLIAPLRDRARLFSLQPPDFDLALAYLEDLAAKEGIKADVEAMKLIAAFCTGYRRLAEALETAAAFSGGERVTAGIVRASLLRDRSQGMLDYLRYCARGQLKEQLQTLQSMNLTSSERVVGILDVLKHLLLRFVGPTRVRRADDRLALLLPDEDCEQVVGDMASKSAELGRTVHGLFDEMLEFWLSLPRDVDDARLEGHVLRFHQLLVFSAAPLDEGPAPYGQHPPTPRLPAVPGPRRLWRMRDHAGLIDRRGEWLTLAQAREGYEAATFLIQQHGRAFNGSLTIEQKGSGDPADEAAAKGISDLLRQLRARFYGASAKRYGAAYDLHRLAFHERGYNHGLLSTVLLHVPEEIETNIREWLTHWSPRDRRVTVALDVSHPITAAAATARQWDLMRFYWGGLDPECVMDGLPVLDLLQVPPSRRRALGMVQCPRLNLSLSIGDQERKKALKDRLGHCSAWADRQWKWLFSGWEMREHKDRVEESRRRANKLDEINRSLATSDLALEQSARQAALAAEKASWPVHPHDRPRRRRTWWESDGDPLKR